MSTTSWEATDMRPTWQDSRRHRFERGSNAGHRLPVDVSETMRNYVVQIALPGVRPEDIEVSAMSHTLIIHVTLRETPWEVLRRASEEMATVATAGYESTMVDDSVTCLHQERPTGEFTRTLDLPWNADAPRVEATYEYGLLVLWIPKLEHTTPKRIAIYTKER